MSALLQNDEGTIRIWVAQTAHGEELTRSAHLGAQDFDWFVPLQEPIYHFGLFGEVDRVAEEEVSPVVTLRFGIFLAVS